MECYKSNLKFRFNSKAMGSHRKTFYQENNMIMLGKDHAVCSNTLVVQHWGGKIKDIAVVQAMDAGCLDEGRNSMRRRKGYGVPQYRSKNSIMGTEVEGEHHQCPSSICMHM